MLALQLERLQRASMLDKIVVATSFQPEDHAIEAFCTDVGIACTRGSVEDVLDRCYTAVAAYKPELVMRLTGDCPLADPTVIDGLVKFFRGGEYDYVSNTLRPTWPDGLDTELMRFECLETAWRDARMPSEREHVTPYIYKHPEVFRLGSYENSTDLSALRWTVDEPADFELVKRIYENLYPISPTFSTQDVLNFLRANDDLATLNVAYERNEGYKNSLARDPVSSGT